MNPSNPFGDYTPYFSSDEFGEDFNASVNLGDQPVEGAQPAPPERPKKVKCRATKARGGSRGGRSGRGGRGAAEEVESDDGELAPKGYTEAETQVLAKCWVDTSQDSIVGNAQTNRSYWNRILDAYHANLPEGAPRRSTQKLRTHWDRVKKLLAEFQQVYKECEIQYRSGENDSDMLSRALHEWQCINGGPFKHLDTWQLVKDTPKFAKVYSAKYQIEETAKRTKTGADGSYSTSASENATTPQSGNSRAQRPMGRDAAKGKRKVGSSSTASEPDIRMHATSKLDSATNAIYDAVDAFNRATDYSIVMKNTSYMSPNEKAFHEAYVAQLKAKHGWDF